MGQVFVAAGTDFNRPVVTSCGSGVTACVLALAVEKLRFAGLVDGPAATVYDGSWSEYAAIPTSSVARGDIIKTSAEWLEE